MNLDYDRSLKINDINEKYLALEKDLIEKGYDKQLLLDIGLLVSLAITNIQFCTITSVSLGLDNEKKCK